MCYISLVVDTDSRAERSFVVLAVKNKEVLSVRQYPAASRVISDPVRSKMIYASSTLVRYALFHVLLFW